MKVAFIMAAQAQPSQQRQTNGHSSLVDLLVKLGRISPDKAQEIKLFEFQTGKSQEKILEETKLVSEVDLTQAKASLYNVPFVNIETIPVSPEALSLVPQTVANRFFVIPLSLDKAKRELVLAMANPLDLSAIEFVEQKTGFSVKPAAVVPSKIRQFIASSYNASLSEEVTKALEETGTPEVKTFDSSEIGQVIREAPIAKIVSTVLEFAVEARASDVHIEAEEGRTRIRYRIDGILQEKLALPKNVHESLISRIKILSGMKIDEKRVPQDGRFNFKTGTEEVDLRVSSLPTSYGEKIVMRLLKKSGGVPDLPELGLRGRALKNLEDAILRPHGIILVTGPTGSGKTTTLYSILSRINTPKVNIVTLEDPVEYQIAGVNQVQVNPGAGLTFASGLRSFLRQDPNIIMVGEIRDRETADLAIQASLTGHLVFSTLHTNDASGALPRLLDIGAEPFLLASSITAIVAQRVARKIHLECKVSYQPAPSLAEDIKKVLGKLLPDDREIPLYKGKGDAECNSTGYYGRIGIFEVIPISERLGRLVLERAPASSIQKQAVEEGMVTMKQDGYLKVVEGITTIEEVLRVAQE